MIPGQKKVNPKAAEEQKTMQALWRFPVNPSETTEQVIERFTRETGKVLAPQFAESLIAESKANNAVIQRAEKMVEIMKSACNLETFFHPFVEHVSVPICKTDPKDLQVIFSSWVHQKFDQAGKKRYEVSLGLAERLAFTELRGIYTKDIRLPFPAILIEIPASLAFGIEVLNMPKVLIIQEETPGGTAEQCGVTRVWNMALFPAHLMNGLQSNDHTILGRLYFWEDDKWTDSVNKSLDAIYSLSPLVSAQTQAMMFAAMGNQDAQRSMFNLVANLVLYSTNHNAREVPTNKEYIELGERIQRTPASAKKERLKERRRSLDPNYKIVLGTGVRRIPDEVREGSKIGVRTLVSGFWRNQAHGPAKRNGEWIPAQERLHKMKWIEPFWRGVELGDDAPETNPTRVMK